MSVYSTYYHTDSVSAYNTPIDPNRAIKQEDMPAKVILELLQEAPVSGNQTIMLV